MRLITVEELFGKPKPPKLSLWYIADILFCTVVFGVGLLVSVKHVYAIWFALPAFLLLMCIFLFRSFYRKTKPTPKPLQIFGIVFRILLLLTCVVALGLPFTMNQSWKWYYPVQRAVFLAHHENKSRYDFLPDAIPSDAQDFTIRCSPKVLSGKDRICLYFYTNHDTLSEYASFAARTNTFSAVIGKVYDYEPDQFGSEEEDLAIQWKAWLNERNIPADGAVVYEFQGYLRMEKPVYIINENTGFFMVSYSNNY